MGEVNTVTSPIVRIRVRLKVGDSLMAATDDPVYLEICGDTGREFRLLPTQGNPLRRGQQDEYVLGPPQDPETNVAHPELNDPTAPPLDAATISAVCLRKGFEPIPNVRAFGEMDDRLELAEIEVKVHTADRAEPILFARRGPLWLGLVCGLKIEIGRVASIS